MATQTLDRQKQDQSDRAEDPAAARAVRRRAGAREEGAGERAPRAHVAGFGTAAAGGKRRPGRRPSRQGLGVDHHRPARTRRRQAAARVPAGCWAATSRRARTRSAPSTTCASCSSTTTRGCSSPRPTTAIGTPTSTTSSTKIPDYLDIIDSAWEGWPGIRSPGAKDYLVKHQITAEGWYVANPDLTVAETRRLKRIGKAVDEFLDKIG